VPNQVSLSLEPNAAFAQPLVKCGSVATAPRAAGRTGQKPELNSKQLQRVEMDCSAVLGHTVFGTDLWTLPLVATVIG
jgi:hypothetical protein